jgi:ribose transport system substrate-binding protein
MVLNVDPNDAPDGRPIVDACTEAGVYVTTQWTRPADLHPWDCNPYYVSYITFDNLKYGEATANSLIKAIGGSGGVSLSAAFSPAMQKQAGEQDWIKR